MVGTYAQDELNPSYDVGLGKGNYADFQNGLTKDIAKLSENNYQNVAENKVASDIINNPNTSPNLEDDLNQGKSFSPDQESLDRQIYHDIEGASFSPSSLSENSFSDGNESEPSVRGASYVEQIAQGSHIGTLRKQELTYDQNQAENLLSNISGDSFASQATKDLSNPSDRRSQTAREEIIRHYAANEGMGISSGTGSNQDNFQNAVDRIEESLQRGGVIGQIQTDLEKDIDELQKDQNGHNVPGHADDLDLTKEELDKQALSKVQNDKGLSGRPQSQLTKDLESASPNEVVQKAQSEVFNSDRKALSDDLKGETKGFGKLAANDLNNFSDLSKLSSGPSSDENRSLHRADNLLVQYADADADKSVKPGDAQATSMSLEKKMVTGEIENGLSHQLSQAKPMDGSLNNTLTKQALADVSGDQDPSLGTKLVRQYANDLDSGKASDYDKGEIIKSLQKTYDHDKKAIEGDQSSTDPFIKQGGQDVQASHYGGTNQDNANQILSAYAANGENLPSDHVRKITLKNDQTAIDGALHDDAAKNPGEETLDKLAQRDIDQQSSTQGDPNLYGEHALQHYSVLSNKNPDHENPQNVAHELKNNIYKDYANKLDTAVKNEDESLNPSGPVTDPKNLPLLNEKQMLGKASSELQGSENSSDPVAHQNFFVRRLMKDAPENYNDIQKGEPESEVKNILAFHTAKERLDPAYDKQDGVGKVKITPAEKQQDEGDVSAIEHPNPKESNTDIDNDFFDLLRSTGVPIPQGDNLYPGNHPSQPPQPTPQPEPSPEPIPSPTPSPSLSPGGGSTPGGNGSNSGGSGNGSGGNGAGGNGENGGNGHGSHGHLKPHSGYSADRFRNEMDTLKSYKLNPSYKKDQNFHEKVDTFKNDEHKAKTDENSGTASKDQLAGDQHQIQEDINYLPQFNRDQVQHVRSDLGNEIQEADAAQAKGWGQNNAQDIHDLHRARSDFENLQHPQTQDEDDYAYNKMSHDEATLHNELPHCFCSGTLIRTVNGDKPVETLKIGDHLLTARGLQKTVKWIGYKEIFIGEGRVERRNTPVCIRKDALEDGVPYKDLYVSPAHAMGFEAIARTLFGKQDTKKVIIRAGNLVNGQSIVQQAVRKVTYWHVQLEDHDLLLANGAAAESFQDMVKRDSFTNGKTIFIHHREADIPANYRDVYPRVKRGRYVRAVRAKIARRIKNRKTVA